MGIPDDAENWAHLGPSGRGLRRRGRRKERRRGGRMRPKGSRRGERKRREGKETNSQGLVTEGKLHFKQEITQQRTKWVDETDTTLNSPGCLCPEKYNKRRLLWIYYHVTSLHTVSSAFFPSSQSQCLISLHHVTKPPSSNMDTVAGTDAVA